MATITSSASRAAFVELRPRYRSDAQTYRALADRFRLDETTIYMIVKGKPSTVNYGSWPWGEGWPAASAGARC